MTQRKSEYGGSLRREWMDWERRYLITHGSKVPVKELAAHLKRSVGAVRDFAWRHDIVVASVVYVPWSIPERALMDKFVLADEPVDFVVASFYPRHTKRTIKALYRKLRRIHKLADGFDKPVLKLSGCR